MSEDDGTDEEGWLARKNDLRTGAASAVAKTSVHAATSAVVSLRVFRFVIIAKLNRLKAELQRP